MGKLRDSNRTMQSLKARLACDPEGQGQGEAVGQGGLTRAVVRGINTPSSPSWPANPVFTSPPVLPMITSAGPRQHGKWAWLWRGRWDHPTEGGARFPWAASNSAALCWHRTRCTGLLSSFAVRESPWFSSTLCRLCHHHAKHSAAGSRPPLSWTSIGFTMWDPGFGADTWPRAGGRQLPAGRRIAGTRIVGCL